LRPLVHDSGLVLLDGFAPGTPADIRPETLGLDAAACHEASCPHRGQVGMTFVPYHKGDVYRGLARCERCGWEIEF
jgi:hypothetical protein